MTNSSQYGMPANYNASQPTLVDGQPSALNLDVNGNLKVTAITSPGNAQAVSDSLSGDTAGTITTNTGTVSATSLDGFSTVTFSISGTYAAFTSVFEQSDDSGVTWYGVDAARVGSGIVENGCTNLTNQNILYRANVAGSDSFRIRATALTSGTVAVLISVTGMPTTAGTSVTSGFADIRPNSGTITIQDTGSTTTGSQQNGSTLITGNATAGSFFSFAVNGTTSFNCLVLGTWTGTLAFEKSNDGGTTWITTTMHTDGVVFTTSSITLNGSFRGSSAGATNIRVRATAAVTGTATVRFNFGSINNVVTINNPVRLSDNTTGNTMAIASASTAPTAVQTAVVVALSPNSNQFNPTGTFLNTYAVHLTTNATTTPTAAIAYISCIVLSSEVAGTTSTVTIQDKSGTPLKLVNGFSTTTLTTTPTVVNFEKPVKMTGGIDIITAGAVAATIDVWISYFQ